MRCSSRISMWIWRISSVVKRSSGTISRTSSGPPSQPEPTWQPRCHTVPKLMPNMPMRSLTDLVKSCRMSEFQQLQGLYQNCNYLYIIYIWMYICMIYIYINILKCFKQWDILISPRFTCRKAASFRCWMEDMQNATSEAHRTSLTCATMTWWRRPSLTILCFFGAHSDFWMFCTWKVIGWCTKAVQLALKTCLGIWHMIC